MKRHGTSSKHSSLFKRFPWRIDITILLFASLLLLVIGLSKPVFRVKNFIFWHEEYTISSGVVNLYRDGQVVIASVILFFSIIFPYTKLGILSIVWFVNLPDRFRKHVLHWLEILGHWSMLDVFVVAIIVVMAKSSWMSDVTPKPGIYFFGSAIILSMIVTFLIQRLATMK